MIPQMRSHIIVRSLSNCCCIEKSVARQSCFAVIRGLTNFVYNGEKKLQPMKELHWIEFLNAKVLPLWKKLKKCWFILSVTHQPPHHHPPPHFSNAVCNGNVLMSLAEILLWDAQCGKNPKFGPIY